MTQNCRTTPSEMEVSDNGALDILWYAMNAGSANRLGLVCLRDNVILGVGV